MTSAMSSRKLWVTKITTRFAPHSQRPFKLMPFHSGPPMYFLSGVEAVGEDDTNFLHDDQPLPAIRLRVGITASTLTDLDKLHNDRQFTPYIDERCRHNPAALGKSGSM